MIYNKILKQLQVKEKNDRQVVFFPYNHPLRTGFQHIALMIDGMLVSSSLIYDIMKERQHTVIISGLIHGQ
jgi:hypothetical protein